MSSKDDILFEITPQVLLKAYACGIFPMAESADDPGMFWVEPEMRGILPLDNFHIPRSLQKTMKREEYEVRIDGDFRQTIRACAEETAARKNTWINERIVELYAELHAIGHAHSVEVWSGADLVGGLYGVRLGCAFFGESMFSRERDTSKIALVHLVYYLAKNGFVLLDTQFNTPHLERFGVVEVPREEYHALLEEALDGEAFLSDQDGGATSDSILQFLSQMS